MIVEQVQSSLTSVPLPVQLGTSSTPLKVNSQFIAYFRVSTAEQRGSGLGIEAQQEKVRQLVAARAVS